MVFEMGVPQTKNWNVFSLFMPISFSDYFLGKLEYAGPSIPNSPVISVADKGIPTLCDFELIWIYTLLYVQAFTFKMMFIFIVNEVQLLELKSPFLLMY